MNKIYSVITNALVVNEEGKILISQRSFDEDHEPGKWTIPGGKIENSDSEKELFGVIEDTLKREVEEEVGVTITNKVKLIQNNIFERSTGQMVLSLVFLTEYENVKEYVQAGFDSFNGV